MKRERITIDEMRELYPNEYLILTECRDNGIDITEGIVVAHDPKLEEINKISGQFKTNIAIWYTGRLLPEGTLFF